MIAAERSGYSRRSANRAVTWFTRIWDASGRNGNYRKAAIAASRVMVGGPSGAAPGGEGGGRGGYRPALGLRVARGLGGPR